MERMAGKRKKEIICGIVRIVLIIMAFNIVGSENQIMGQDINTEVKKGMDEIKDGNYMYIGDVIKRWGKETAPFLVQYLEDSNIDVRAEAAYLIGSMQYQEGIPSLIVILNKDPQSEVQRRCIEGLAKFTNEILKLYKTVVIPALLEYIGSLGVESDKAALILGNIAASEYLNSIRQIYEEVKQSKPQEGGQQHIRNKLMEAYLACLAKLGDQESRRAIIEELQSVDLEKKVMAICAMYYIGDKELIKHLVPLLDDQSVVPYMIPELNVPVEMVKDKLVKVCDLTASTIWVMTHPSLSFDPSQDSENLKNLPNTNWDLRLLWRRCYTKSELKELKEWCQKNL